MAIRTRIEPIQKDIEVLLRDDLSPEGRGKAFAAFAREQLVDAQETNRRVLGEVPPHETFVDGRAGGRLEDVKSTVVFEFELIGDAVEWIHSQLQTHSPVRSGRYRKSHIILADGAEIAPGTVAAAEEYVFVNTQPYSRKLERGLSRQAPDGVFQAVATLAGKRFGNFAAIKFTYRSLLLDYVPLGGVRGRDKKGRFINAPNGGARRSAHYIEQESRQPAILMRVR